MQFQVATLHPLVEAYVIHVLSRDREMHRFLPAPSTAKPVEPPEARIVLLDGCSLPIDIGQLIRAYRHQCPGSKFLAMVDPAIGLDGMVRLLYMGVDGIVQMGDAFERELRAAIESLHAGKLWVSGEVLSFYVKQTNLLVNNELRTRLSLTAREDQIVQLMIRRMSNKEIALALGITERTVKFHVSNVFLKTGTVNRRELLERVGGPVDVPAPLPHVGNRAVLSLIAELELIGRSRRPPQRVAAIRGRLPRKLEPLRSAR